MADAPRFTEEEKVALGISKRLSEETKLENKRVRKEKTRQRAEVRRGEKLKISEGKRLTSNRKKREALRLKEIKQAVRAEAKLVKERIDKETSLAALERRRLAAAVKTDRQRLVRKQKKSMARYAANQTEMRDSTNPITEKVGSNGVENSQGRNRQNKTYAADEVFLQIDEEELDQVQETVAVQTARLGRYTYLGNHVNTDVLQVRPVCAARRYNAINQVPSTLADRAKGDNLAYHLICISLK